MTKKASDTIQPLGKPLKEGEDYILENGLMVLSKKFLLERGYCCNSGCRNCPYPAPTTKKKTTD